MCICPQNQNRRLLILRAHKQLKSLLFDWNESPFKVRLVDIVPLGDWGVVGSLCSLNVNTFSRVNKFDSPPSFFNFLESNLQVSLVSMSVLVPDRDTTTIVVVRTKLMEDKVGVSRTVNIVGSVGSGRNGPLEVCLVSMGGFVPSSDMSIIFTNAIFEMGNNVISKSALDVALLPGLGELFRFLVVLLGFNRDEAPFKVGLINIVPLGDWVVVSRGGSLNVNTLVGMSKSDGPEVSTLVVKMNLQVGLVPMSVLVPDRDTTTIVVVSTKLMEDKVGVSRTVNMVGSVGSPRNGPLEVCLVSMSASVPNSDMSIIFTNAIFEMGNSVWVKGRDNVDFLSGVCEFEW